MNDLFPETLLVSLTGDRCFTTSLKVAEHFGKNHHNVLRSIRSILEPNCGLSAEFTALNFECSEYLDRTGRALPMYEMTRDGFSILAMGFTGMEAMRWKESFLAAFNAMEAQLHARTARYAAALDQVRPSLRPIVEGTERGLCRSAIAAPLGKSAAAVSYHRRNARRLGLLADRAYKP